LAAKSIRQAVHDSKLDHSIMKRDASSRKGNSGAAKAEASLKLPDWYGDEIIALIDEEALVLAEIVGA
jgi:hypothetical protein